MREPPERRKAANRGDGDLSTEDQLGKQIGEEGSQPNPPHQAPLIEPGDLGESPEDHGPPRVLDIYDSLGLLGSVCIARSVRAVRPDGTELGVFPTIEEARRAVVRDADSRREVASW